MVFRALKLGDMLCAVPAFRALRGGFPAARITLVGLPWARDFFTRYRSYIDEFCEFPGYPGLPEQPPRIDCIPDFLAAMQEERFDLAIQMHGSGLISNPLVMRFGAATNARFYQAGSDCPGAGFLPYPGRGLELQRLLRLIEHIGVPARGESLEFPLTGDDRAEAQRLAVSLGLSREPYVVIHPGASVPERRWPAARFVEVATALSARGLAIVLTGTASESDLNRAIVRALSGAASDLSGQTPLGTLAALLADARLLICNDTGVSHLADALKIPSVVISTGNNPERWAPADSRLHRVLCRDAGVSSEEVIAAALALLGVEPALDLTSAHCQNTVGGAPEAYVEGR